LQIRSEAVFSGRLMLHWLSYVIHSVPTQANIVQVCTHWHIELCFWNEHNSWHWRVAVRNTCKAVPLFSTQTQSEHLLNHLFV